MCLPTCAPGVEEEDELDAAAPPQGHAPAADGCVSCGADGQGHDIPGRAGDRGAPRGRVVRAGREIKHGPGAVLVGGGGTWVGREQSEVSQAVR